MASQREISMDVPQLVTVGDFRARNAMSSLCSSLEELQNISTDIATNTSCLVFNLNYSYLPAQKCHLSSGNSLSCYALDKLILLRNAKFLNETAGPLKM